jgi:predicted AAA+ superfamily ATPase
LEIKSAEQVSSHFLRGGLFENMVVNEFTKEALNVGVEPELTFWRDKTGNEVDLLRQDGSKQIAYEIKSGATFSSDYFSNLGLWARLSGATADQCNVIYGGEKNLKTSQGEVLAWRAPV